MPETKHRSSPDFGSKLGLKIFHFALKWLGPTPAYIMLVFVVPYYVFILRRPRELASHYLKHRFPKDGRIKRLFRTYYYIYKFGLVLIDQAAIGILGREAFKIDFPEWETILNLSEKKKGMVLVTSHIGNWQTSMAVVEDLASQVNFLITLEDHMDGRHFFDLTGKKEKINIIDPTGFLGGLVEAIRVLEQGQCVAIMGDRAWGARTQLCEFLGEKAAFPITPYHLVSAIGANLVMLLTVRTGKLAFRIDFFYLSGEDTDWTKTSRQEAINILLGRYVKTLEEYVQKYPYMWFNIFNFWSEDKQDLEKENI